MPEAPIDTQPVSDARAERAQKENARLLRPVSRLLLLAPLVLGLSQLALAQLPEAPLPLSNTEDARTLPKGTVRLRALNAWTRIDEVYDAAADSANRLHPLGNAFASGALGVRELPSLLPAQSALRTLTGDANFQLNVGQLVSSADSRVVTTPFTLEYGVTNRLTLGVTVPVIQTHTTVFVELNPRAKIPPRIGNPITLGLSAVNVGPNPAKLGNSNAQQANQGVINQLTDALGQLHSYIAGCASSGTCSPSDVSSAMQAAVQDSLFRNAIAVIYGTDNTASPFAPFGSAQTTINSRLTSLQTTVNGLLGTSYSFTGLAGANAPAALLQLQQLATALPGIGYDSLGSPDRIGIGDVEVSAAFKLMDGFGDTTRNRAVRTLLRAVVRLPTGQPTFGIVPFEVGTGTHQTGGDLAAIVDTRLSRRFMATLVAQYTAYFTNAALLRVPNSDYSLFPLVPAVPGMWREGNAIQLEATPRVQLTSSLSFNGAYALRHQAAPQYTTLDGSPAPVFDATTEQRVGLGFGYSTVNRYQAGRSSFPFEVFFTHLETIAASGGLTPKYRRDQVELRIYYRLFRPGR